MSTDFNVVCDKCKKVRHLGQRMAMTYSFGFGSKDSQGAADAAEWIEHHLGHGSLRIVGTDDSSIENYDYVHDEKASDTGPSEDRD